MCHLGGSIVLGPAHRICVEAAMCYPIIVSFLLPWHRWSISRLTDGLPIHSILSLNWEQILR